MGPFFYACYGELSDVLNIDQYSKALGIIDQEHLEIHAGNGFTIASRSTIANVGGVQNYLGVVPAGIFPHFRSIIIASDGGPFSVDFYEAPTTSANGSLVPAKNNNRNSAKVSTMEIYSGPTVSADGDLLEAILIPGTKQSGSFGSDGSNEWILKSDTNYLIRITNNTTGVGTSNFTLNMFFYDEQAA